MKYWYSLLCVLCLLGGNAFAQLSVSIASAKKNYVSGEAVIAEITLSNNTNRDVELKKLDALPWLDIVVTDSGSGMPLSQIRFPEFPRVVVPAGKQVQRKVDLRHLYVLSRSGYYKMQAIVRLPGGRDVHASTQKLFNVQMGRTVVSRTVPSGVGGRVKYVLCSLMENDKQQLYVQTRDDGDRILNAVVLGSWMSFYQPLLKTDSESSLHIFFQTTPKYYIYACVDASGKRLWAKYYGRAVGEEPRLVNNAGKVSVVGGYHYDPSQVKTPKARDVNDLPAAARGGQ